MDFHDGVILLVLSALVVLVVGKILIWLFFRAKRRHQLQLMRDLLRGDTIS